MIALTGGRFGPDPMTTPYPQIALQARPLCIEDGDPAPISPPLAALRLGLGMLFVGMMLTLGVTLSLAAPGPERLAPTIDVAGRPLVSPSMTAPARARMPVPPHGET